MDKNVTTLYDYLVNVRALQQDYDAVIKAIDPIVDEWKKMDPQPVPSRSSMLP